MPKYLVRVGFCIAAGRDVYPGDVVELEEKDAVANVYNGRLVLAPEVAAPAAPPASTPTNTGGKGRQKESEA